MTHQNIVIVLWLKRIISGAAHRLGDKTAVPPPTGGVYNSYINQSPNMYNTDISLHIILSYTDTLTHRAIPTTGQNSQIVNFAIHLQAKIWKKWIYIKISIILLKHITPMGQISIVLLKHALHMQVLTLPGDPPDWDQRPAEGSGTIEKTGWF